MSRTKKYVLIIGIALLVVISSIVVVQQQRLAGKVPVLIYHAIGDNPHVGSADYLYVSTDKFERQMHYLQLMGYTPIWAKDIGKLLPKKPVVITFDDGYRSNYQNAYPILKKYGFKATIFVIGHTADEHLPNYLTWEEMRTMVDSGLMDMESHTYNLHYIDQDQRYGEMPLANEDAQSYENRIGADIAQQNIAFERELGYRPTAIAYPNGYYTAELDAIYRNSDYASTFTTEPVFAQPGKGTSALPRVPVFDKTRLSALLNCF